MSDDAAILTSLAEAAAEADQLRARASQLLRTAVGEAADYGLTQTQIAQAVGRSQPEVSRLLQAYRAGSFRLASPLGRLLTRHPGC